VACVAALRQAYEQPELRAHLARVGQQDVLRQQKIAWSAPFLKEFPQLCKRPVKTSRRGKQRALIVMNEVLDPTLRRLNWKALLARARIALSLNVIDALPQTHAPKIPQDLP
jgi:poly-beta-hydroxyalkanoate depolymerase